LKGKRKITDLNGYIYIYMDKQGVGLYTSIRVQGLNTQFSQSYSTCTGQQPAGINRSLTGSKESTACLLSVAVGPCGCRCMGGERESERESESERERRGNAIPLYPTLRAL